ncbi:type II secretion system protein [Vibrio metschnikovii]|uniref:type II secretion system protein n=1 Tax=Vibrio metschnikovii TaxID=28172 RepID=UPI001C30E8BA|nr:type II secretion system protein [Vibrio metschnikovii]EKO3566107.1 type II secretion system protein [Vibrio metschnikovii]EKO3770705.1 type II secretion system protein [Vibrio metschnikovii]
MNRDNQGFTLIEVLVAITILVSAFSAIFPLLNQSHLQNNKVNQALENVMIQESLLEMISAENPGLKQAGAGQLSSGVLYKWQAQSSTDELMIRGDASDPRRLRLYEVHVEYEWQQRKHQFSFEQIGWYDK